MDAGGRAGREEIKTEGPGRGEIKEGRGGQPQREEGREPLESCGALLS